MKQDKLNELSRLILRLIRQVAKVNRTHSSTRVGDIIWLHKGKSEDTYPHQVDQLFLGRDYKQWVIIERDTQLLDEVVDKLHKLRKNLIPRKLVETELIGLVEEYHNKGWRLQGIHKSINRLLNNKTAEEGKGTIVFLPITGLVLEVAKFEIGDVEFLDRAKLKDIDDKLQKLEGDLGKYAKFSPPKTIAVTKATGDRETALQTATQKVNQALNIFRCFKYPAVEKQIAPLKQIGIMGEYPASMSYHLVTTGGTDEILEGYRLSGAGEIVITDNLLNELSRRGFNKLSRLLIGSPSPIESALLRAAEWLGEATKPDRLETKFLKVAFAIDAMVGEESSENIPDKGITARIAERSAFLLSNKGKGRKEIYDDMRKFIMKRNSLAHGGKGKVNESETERLGKYARGLLTRLLDQQPPFRLSEELAQWVQLQSLKG